MVLVIRISSYSLVACLQEIDILFESFTQDFLCNEIGKYYGPERKIRLGLTYDRYSPPAPTLEVIVQDYSPPSSADPVLYNVVAVDEKSFENVQSERYAIIPQSMPTLAEILCWVKMTIPAIGGNPVQRLIIALKDFMSQYCEHRPILPMVSPPLHCWWLLRNFQGLTNLWLVALA